MLLLQFVHLPRKQACTLLFLKAILEGSKKYLYQGQFKKFSVPVIEELGVKSMWPTAMTIPEFPDYVPDEWIETKGKKADRTFFWEIVSTLQPEYVMALINDVQQQRMDRKKAKKINPTVMQINDKWLHKLNSYPWVSGKYFVFRSIDHLLFQRRRTATQICSLR